MSTSSDNSFVFYLSFFEAISLLDEKDRLKAYDAICNYALTGEIPECDGASQIVFVMAKPQIDANRKKRKDGKTGGRPPNQNKNLKEVQLNNSEGYPEQNHWLQNTEPNEKVNEKENGNSECNENERSTNDVVSPSNNIPSLSEIEGYCSEIGTTINPETFYNYYSANGWKIKGEQIQDWQAVIRLWELRDNKTGNQKEKNRKHQEHREKIENRLSELEIKREEAIQNGDKDLEVAITYEIQSIEDSINKGG